MSDTKDHTDLCDPRMFKGNATEVVFYKFGRHTQWQSVCRLPQQERFRAEREPELLRQRLG